MKPTYQINIRLTEEDWPLYMAAREVGWGNIEIFRLGLKSVGWKEAQLGEWGQEALQELQKNQDREGK